MLMAAAGTVNSKKSSRGTALIQVARFAHRGVTSRAARLEYVKPTTVIVDRFTV
jgi:hypothetical protein